MNISRHEEAGVTFEYYIEEGVLSYKMNRLRCDVEEETMYDAFRYIFEKENIKAQDITGPVVEELDRDGWYRFSTNYFWKIPFKKKSIYTKHGTEKSKKNKKKGRNKMTNEVTKENETELRPVVVCTLYRGVFFGYAKDTAGETIKLVGARNCKYWTNEVQGILGLGTVGPLGASQVGSRANIEVRKVTLVIEVTREARQNWEDAKWDI